MKQFHLYLISDSTGETVSSVARASLAQFDKIDAIEHVWSLIRTTRQLDKVLKTIEENPGVVMYTLVSREHRDALKQLCHRLNVPCIPVLARPVTELTAYLGIQTSNAPGRQYELTESYFSRVEAINYTLAHDDGQNTWELEEADIVLVGVSRTSKSPTCVYLANRGYKAANVPFVPTCPLPDNIERLRRPLVVGLTISAEHLIQIRKSRLESILHHDNTSYVDRDIVMQELLEAKRFFAKNKWPHIDVTRKSVEETAATIIQYYDKHREKQLKAQ